MKRPQLFLDPVAEYTKPDSVEIVINGNGPFPVLESVLHGFMNNLGFTDADVKSATKNQVIYAYKPHKGKE